MNLLAASSYSMDSPFNFTLPAELEASEPPEVRGLARDEVRLMISYRSDNRVVHTRFRELSAYLEAGDLLVINTSGTLNAALPARRADGTAWLSSIDRLIIAYWPLPPDIAIANGETVACEVIL